MKCPLKISWTPPGRDVLTDSSMVWADDDAGTSIRQDCHGDAFPSMSAATGAIATPFSVPPSTEKALPCSLIQYGFPLSRNSTETTSNPPPRDCGADP